MQHTGKAKFYSEVHFLQTTTPWVFPASHVWDTSYLMRSSMLTSVGFSESTKMAAFYVCLFHTHAHTTSSLLHAGLADKPPTALVRELNFVFGILAGRIVLGPGYWNALGTALLVTATFLCFIVGV
jgi:hypothetical protein